MKKIILIITAVLFAASLFAQSPEKMSYQAVVRDGSGILVQSHAVGMRIQILQTSEFGAAVYVETHSAATNVNGLVTIEIGSGSPVLGTFAGINWSNGPYFIKTETDPDGGTNYTAIVGTSQLLSAPYALYAKKAATYSETDPLFNISEAKNITLSNTSNWNTAFGWGDHASAGYAPLARDLTINGATMNLTADRTWNVGTVTSITTNNGITGGTITTTGAIGLTGQALALHNLGTNGLIARTASGTVAARTIGSGNGISVTNGDGVNGNPTVSASFGTTATTVAAGDHTHGQYLTAETDPTWKGGSDEIVAIGRTGNVGIGILTPEALLHVYGIGTGGGNVLFAGAYKSTPGDPPASGAGTRMMWYPDKAAFRAGHVTGNYWNKDSIGNYSVALGYQNRAKGNYSFAIGINALASGIQSTAMGSATIASGSISTAIGNTTKASGIVSTAMGNYTTASASYSTTMGNGTEASGSSSTAMGVATTASGLTSTAMGYYTDATGDYSTALGYSALASGNTSTAMGGNTVASANYSTAMGYNTDATFQFATAMGYYTLASGNVSTAMGNYTTASASYSTAMGYYTDATGGYSTAMGNNATASGSVSFAMGNYVSAPSGYETAIGCWSTNYTPVSTTGSFGGDRLFVIGNGTSTSERSNAITVLKNGNTGIGIDNPGIYKLYVTGSAFSTGLWMSSDIRWKTNITDIGNIMSKIMNLRPVTYNWRTDEFPDRGFDTDLQLGLIAQEAEEVFPELVKTNDDGYKSLNYAKLTVILLEGMKEQQAQIESYKLHLQSLQQEVDQIKALLVSGEAK